MIKVCKVMLYKINLILKRGQLEKQEFTNMITSKMKQIYDSTASQVNEVITFSRVTPIGYISSTKESISCILAAYLQ